MPEALRLVNKGFCKPASLVVGYWQSFLASSIVPLGRKSSQLPSIFIVSPFLYLSELLTFSATNILHFFFFAASFFFYLMIRSFSKIIMTFRMTSNVSFWTFIARLKIVVAHICLLLYSQYICQKIIGKKFYIQPYDWVYYYP